MRHLALELRYAWRGLARSPLFLIVAVLSLGVALALNTTMFALVDGVLHPPVPFEAADRLYSIGWRGDDPRNSIPNAEKHAAIREGLRGIEASAVASRRLAPVIAGNDADDEIIGSVGPDFFDVVRVRPHTGRLIGPHDVGQPVALISLSLWRRSFAARPLREGVQVEIDGVVHAVVGVLPAGMHAGAGTVWVPQGAGSDSVRGAFRWSALYVRLAPGITMAQAESDLANVAKRLQAARGSARYPLYARLYSERPEPPRRGLDVFYKVMFATVGIVLAIACANLATLLFARGAAKRRETAVRIAIGASRASVMRQVLLECAIVALGGAAVGMLLTYWGTDIIAHYGPAHVAELGDFVPEPSWRVFAFAFGVALAVLVLAGALPAIRAANTPPAEPLKDGAGTTSRRKGRYSLLVVTEVALSTGLLMMAALFVMSSWRLAAHRFRFDARRLVTASFGVWKPGTNGGWSGVRYTGVEAEKLYADVATRLRRLDGVRDVAWVAGTNVPGPVVMGENGRSGERWMNLRAYNAVSPSYLRTMAIPIVQGRDFSDGDRGNGDGVVIVDQDAARRLFPDHANPVGRMIKLGGPQDRTAPWLRVIGVALAPGREPNTPERDPSIYVVYGRDTATTARTIVIATEKEAIDMPLVVRRELQRIVGTGSFLQVDRYLAGHESRTRWTTFLAALYCALSGFSLVLCAVGLYGVLAYTVSLRTREFAIRIALGARQRNVARAVVHDAAVMALAGVGIGAFMALAATRPVMDTLYAGGTFLEAKALLAAEVVLLLVAFVAALEPVRRGVRADPARIIQST